MSIAKLPPLWHCYLLSAVLDGAPGGAHPEVRSGGNCSIMPLLLAGMGRRPYGPQQPIEPVHGALRELDMFIACSTPSVRLEP